MLYCRKCRHTLEDKARYCSECGVEQCQCGMEHLHNARKFCPKCGFCVGITFGEFVDARDNRKYKTIEIGSQIWMAENLCFNMPGSKCYGNFPENGEKYGRLYDWNIAMKAAPAGWHLPSYEEWKTLVNFVGGEEKAGLKLKAAIGWIKNDNGEPGDGTDEYGFIGLAGGYATAGDTFRNINYRGNWWCSKEAQYNPEFAHYFGMYNASPKIEYGDYEKKHLCSVRCVKN